ncbi:hypothetical protein QQ045_003396 [Rhodiola kirilowii]
MSGINNWQLVKSPQFKTQLYDTAVSLDNDLEIQQQQQQHSEEEGMERDPLIQQQPSFSSSFFSSLINRLYVAHFLARWDSRMWEFSVGLYMINIWPESLLLTAVYGVVEASSTALFGPMIGQLVDRFTYMKVLRLWLVTQNISFIVAGGTVVGLLVYSSLKYTNLAAFISLVVLTNVFGAVSVLSTLAGTILIEREW